MSNIVRIGAVLGLALCSTAFLSCSRQDDRTGQGNAQEAAAAALEWSGRAEKQLLEAIAGAPAHGLKPSLFLSGDLPKDDSERSGVLTKAALRYAEALAHGYVDPKTTAEIYTIPRPKADLRAALGQAIRDGNLDQWLASLAPQTDEYRALSQAYLNYLRMASQARSPPIAEGRSITPGSRDPRLPAIAASLQSAGYAVQPESAAQSEQRYGPALAAAVKQLQADFGLEPDGIIGETTLAALNSGLAGRARQLAVALERLRWLERSPPATRIDVNTAAAVLEYYRDGRLIDRRKVIVGEPGWETPQLQSPMVQLVANPVWRVPDSIIEDELGAKSAAYLAANGFEHRDGRLVQKPGPKNSLGLVKFDLENKESIYLHDTPAKALFAEPERHKSHGCIRVENALQLASLIASQENVLPQFDQALATRDENFVKLRRQIPVRLLYRTAFWDGSRVQLRPDLYGWDDNVARGLGLERGPDRKPYVHKKGDVGP